jgi:hypothetical protein
MAFWSFNQFLNESYSALLTSFNDKYRSSSVAPGWLKGETMRIIALSVILAVFVPLGGCFHHTQAVSVEPLSTPSIK